MRCQKRFKVWVRAQGTRSAREQQTPKPKQHLYHAEPEHRDLLSVETFRACIQCGGGLVRRKWCYQHRHDKSGSEAGYAPDNHCSR